ncbi:terpenoid synthase [Daldinia vernicosa]|uniref:terpenoid synthase n=1 Tax=Daldinia vernicosa TaxID=114800 RepID=UPI0020081F55|nr:terpenoid synthase [Daldinia vernicosa]KAI0850474.1 terpenoid synthase [Daldinia vernicosa]
MAGSSESAEQREGTRSVRIPDLFSSIMSPKPVLNPNYAKVKAEGDEWIARIMKMDEKTSARNKRVDFCYLGALWAPDADEESLRVLLDWCHWFDEGHLKDDPVAAQEEIKETMAIMEEDVQLIEPHVNPLRYVFQLCWLAINREAELRQQYKEQHKEYFDQIVVQVQQAAKGEVLRRDVQTYIEVRRGSIGVTPAISIIRCIEGVELPEMVVSHSSLQECRRLSSELVFMVNDIISYRKDLELSVDHNLIPLLVEQGMSVQQSIDKIGAMIDDCYKRWYTALAELPSYGEKVDREVLLFIEICRNVALGNLYWSFKTARYLDSEEGQNVHETRILYLPY